MQLWQAKAAKKKKYKNQYSQLSYVTKETAPWKKNQIKKEIIFVIQLQVNAEKHLPNAFRFVLSNTSLTFWYASRKKKQSALIQVTGAGSQHYVLKLLSRLPESTGSSPYLQKQLWAREMKLHESVL